MKEGRTKCCRLLRWWCLFPLLVLTLALSSLARLGILYDTGEDDGGIQWANAQESLASCSYDQLEAAFGQDVTPSSTTSNPFSVTSEQDTETCWSLTDRILHVPSSAILNFHSLIPLGAGCKGGVFLVFLNLSDEEPPCKAVYKTDIVHTNLCANVWRHPFTSPWFRTKSCLSAHLQPFQSSMPGELTGGLLFQAFRQHNAEHPDEPLDTTGILQTWAMVPTEEEVTDDEGQTHHHHGLRHHHRGDYPGVLGMIMPYVALTPLSVQAAQSRTAAQLAALLQTAAQGLAHVHELGLTHQDLVASDLKNVGVFEKPNGESASIIFDWGYTAYDDDAGEADEEVCSLGRACDFCVESYFPKPRVGGSHGSRGSRRRTLDCDNLRTMVEHLLGEVTDAAQEGRYWIEQLQSHVDCGRSTQELADLLALAAQDEH
jgi:hypothetical protein